MFSLSNDTMNKMTENNPLLAMMPNSEAVKKTTEAWMKSVPVVEGVPNKQMAAAAVASSAIGFGIYSQMVGSMFGAMTGAMNAAEKMKDDPSNSATPFGMMFNPLTFEWVGDGSMPAMEEATKTKPVPVKAAPAVVEPAMTPKADIAAEAAPVPKAKVAKRKSVEPKLKVVDSAPAIDAAEAEFKKPGRIAKPETPDDLKLIAGVGPKLEQVLNGLGVWTYKQIEDWSQPEIAWVDDFLQFKGRIDRDEWLKQAKELAAK